MWGSPRSQWAIATHSDMVQEGQVILSDWGKGGANDAFESYTQAHDTQTHILENHTHHQRHIQSHKDIHKPIHKEKENEERYESPPK